MSNESRMAGFRNDFGCGKTLKEKFVEWLEETQQPIWDDRLVDLMEDGDMQIKFLDYMELPEDTEID